MKSTQIYTDGSCPTNPGKGGWAAIVVEDGEEVRALGGNAREATNNSMELTAVLEAIRYVNEDTPTVSIYSDSQYVVKAVNEGWLKNWLRKDPTLSKRANGELFFQLQHELNMKPNVKLVWVRGHNGNKWNERADEVAGLYAETPLTHPKVQPIIPVVKESKRSLSIELELLLAKHKEEIVSLINKYQGEKGSEKY